MSNLELLIASILPIILIIKPMLCANFIGKIYWKLNNILPFSMYGKGEESKKFFIATKPFWFRTLGFIWLALIAYAFVLNNTTP